MDVAHLVRTAADPIPGLLERLSGPPWPGGTADSFRPAAAAWMRDHGAPAQQSLILNCTCDRARGRCRLCN